MRRRAIPLGLMEAAREEGGHFGWGGDGEHGKTGGASTGQAGGGILDYEWRARAQEFSGLAIRFGIGLVVGDILGADEGVEVMAQAAGGEERVDLGARARGHDGQLIIAMELFEKAV